MERIRTKMKHFGDCKSVFFTLLIFVNTFETVLPLHLKGTWKNDQFYFFLAKFGFQQTDMHDTVNTQGYIYGNVTSKSHPSTPLTLTVVDSEYFLQYYGNRSRTPLNKACSSMFNKIKTIAWDPKCYRDGREDFTRRIPCPLGKLCFDEDNPNHVVKGYQFTYAVEDTRQPRFWYASFVACHQNSTTEGECSWTHNDNQSLEIDYDIWLVNGSPFTKKFNPFEHQFSFEHHDVFEIYLTFFLLYIFLVPLQLYAFSKEKHMLPLILTISISMEFIGVFFNFIHVFKFAFDGRGVEILKLTGNFIDQLSQCMFMLLLLLIVKGWTITRRDLVSRSKLMLYLVWITYTVANMALFIWNITAVDIISDIDEWQTLPGYLILTFRIGIMIWFLLELRDTFILEQRVERVRFYLHFGAGYLVWFVYLPIVAIIGTQLSALWRYKTILSVSYAADFISFAALVHLLWPSQSTMYFNLKLETLAEDQVNIKGGFVDFALTPMEEHADTMSEDSFDIHDTAMLIRQRNNTGGTNTVRNGHAAKESIGSPVHNGHVVPAGPASASTSPSVAVVQGMENGDSGVESIANGDSQESLGVDAQQHQLINIQD